VHELLIAKIIATPAGRLDDSVEDVKKHGYAACIRPTDINRRRAVDRSLKQRCVAQGFGPFTKRAHAVALHRAVTAPSTSGGDGAPVLGCEEPKGALLGTLDECGWVTGILCAHSVSSTANGEVELGAAELRYSWLRRS
jgi:hypothetical protein